MIYIERDVRAPTVCSLFLFPAVWLVVSETRTATVMWRLVYGNDEIVISVAYDRNVCTPATSFRGIGRFDKQGRHGIFLTKAFRPTQTEQDTITIPCLEHLSSMQILSPATPTTQPRYPPTYVYTKWLRTRHTHLRRSGRRSTTCLILPAGTRPTLSSFETTLMSCLTLQFITFSTCK